MRKASTRLTVRQEKFIAGVVSAKSAKAAAVAAGFHIDHAKRLVKQPLIAAAIEAARAEVRRAAVYDATVAMHELKEAKDFALRTENANAYTRACELRAKLSGLLSDRLQVEVAYVDLAGALSEARARVGLPGVFQARGAVSETVDFSD